MSPQQEQKHARRAELEKIDTHELWVLARKHGINLLNRPFVIEAILDEEFPELKPDQSHGKYDGNTKSI